MAPTQMQKMSGLAVLIASVLGIVSVFLTWYSVGEMSLVPFSVGTGKLLLVLGLVGAAMGILGFVKTHIAFGIVSILMGLAFIGIVYLNMPTEANIGEGFSLIKIEMGFWLSMVSGGLLALSGIWKTITK